MKCKIKKLNIYLLNRVRDGFCTSFSDSDFEDAFAENGLFIIKQKTRDTMYPLGAIERIEVIKEES